MGTVIVILIVIGVVVAVVRSRADRPSAPDPAPGAVVTSASAPPKARSWSPPPTGPRDSIPSAKPGMKGRLFTYGGQGHPSLTQSIEGPFAVIDFQTTGLAPSQGDRVIEVAVVRIENGVVGQPWSTLINPGRDTGADFIHHISSAEVADAPTFAEIAPYLLSLLDGAVVVAHSAPFDEAFLVSELERAGYNGARMPALCSLVLARKSFSTPNFRLPTLARELGVPMTNNVSVDHVLATAAVIQRALQSQTVLHACAPYTWDGGDVSPPRVVTRARGLRKGTDGYMSSLMARLPSDAADADDADKEAYLDLLTAAMADGQITREEAQELGRLAGQVGLSQASVSELNERFLEGMREAAFDDGVLTAAELRDLKRAAKALGVPTYFDDLSPTPVSGSHGTTRAPRKCGHCGEPGHYRPKCPQLVQT
jgi:DNA polymerase-3 subunit epsilon